jgi:hypothetical protein
VHGIGEKTYLSGCLIYVYILLNPVSIKGSTLRAQCDVLPDHTSMLSDDLVEILVQPQPRCRGGGSTEDLTEVPSR